jgi:hypothetical protein
MKTIIAGSRDITDYEIVCEVMSKLGCKDWITEVVCGMARGVDLLGKQWANYWNIPIKEFPANWQPTFFGDPDLVKGYDPTAGPKRNGEMVAYADCLIAILHRGSKGTSNCIMQAMNKPMKYIYIHYVDGK